MDIIDELKTVNIALALLIFFGAVAVGVFLAITIEPPSLDCREYTDSVMGLDYDGRTWTRDNGQLVGYADTETSRIWNHPSCI